MTMSSASEHRLSRIYVCIRSPHFRAKYFLWYLLCKLFIKYALIVWCCYYGRSYNHWRKIWEKRELPSNFQNPQGQ